MKKLMETLNKEKKKVLNLASDLRQFTKIYRLFILKCQFFINKNEVLINKKFMTPSSII